MIQQKARIKSKWITRIEEMDKVMDDKMSIEHSQEMHEIVNSEVNPKTSKKTDCKISKEIDIEVTQGTNKVSNQEMNQGTNKVSNKEMNQETDKETDQEMPQGITQHITTKEHIPTQEDLQYMMIAIEEAKKAYELDETPIGAIIVYQGEIIGRACNRRNTNKNTLAHAEVLAIGEACEHMGDWRLEECTIYITLEPCPMCAGAIVQSRIPRVVYGASSPKAGFGGSLLNVLEMDELNHRCEVLRGVAEEESSALLKAYFKDMRQKRKNKVQKD